MLERIKLKIYPQLNSNSTVLSASGPGGASYTVRTVEGAGSARARTTLSGLQKHAAYAVVVQAYNSRGAGPASPPTTSTTMEDGKIESPLTYSIYAEIIHSKLHCFKFTIVTRTLTSLKVIEVA